MRTLTSTEMQFTTGGNGAALLTGMLLTTLAVSALYSSIASAYSNCKWEPYIKEIKTPIYDAYGQHIANNVDTYQDYRWVCV